MWSTPSVNGALSGCRVVDLRPGTRRPLLHADTLGIMAQTCSSSNRRQAMRLACGDLPLSTEWRPTLLA